MLVDDATLFEAYRRIVSSYTGAAHVEDPIKFWRAELRLAVERGQSRSGGPLYASWHEECEALHGNVWPTGMDHHNRMADEAVAS